MLCKLEILINANMQGLKIEREGESERERGRERERESEREEKLFSCNDYFKLARQNVKKG